MKTISAKISDEKAKIYEQKANDLGISLSELIKQAIDEKVARKDEKQEQNVAQINPFLSAKIDYIINLCETMIANWLIHHKNATESEIRSFLDQFKPQELKEKE